MEPQPNKKAGDIFLLTPEEVQREAIALNPTAITYILCYFIIDYLGATQSNGEPLEKDKLANQVFGSLKDTIDSEINKGIHGNQSIGVALALALIRRLNLIIPTQAAPTIQSQ